MALPHIAVGQDHIKIHNDERDAINELNTPGQTERPFLGTQGEMQTVPVSGVYRFDETAQSVGDLFTYINFDFAPTLYVQKFTTGEAIQCVLGSSTEDGTPRWVTRVIDEVDNATSWAIGGGPLSGGVRIPD